MRGILADINVEGHLTRIRNIWLSSDWRDMWQGLRLAVETFDSLGLPVDALDESVWRRCQEDRLVLITGNRNADRPDSLESTIRRENQPDSLPVVTLATPDRVMRDRLYAEKVAERLLEYLTAIDDVRGAGRIYVP